MKLYFTGSDVQLLNEFPKQLSKKRLPYVWFLRLSAKLAAMYSEEVWVVHEHLIPELNKFGIKDRIKVVRHPILHNTKIPKVKHEGFNILYYWHKGQDQDWTKWIYGYDIFQKIKKVFSWTEDIRFIELNNCNQSDLSNIYPITDFYLRPNRHDGQANMVLECEIQEIPYYWSYEKPDINEIVIQIRREYERTMQKMPDD